MGRLALMKNYLAGGIDRVHDNGKGWRDDIKPFLVNLGVIVLDPLEKPIDTGLENTENIKERRLWKRDKKYELLQQHMKTIRHIDLRMVDKADFVIVHIDINSHACGTYEELFWANRCKSPILIHCEQGKSQAPDWLFGVVPHEMIFSTWDELKEYLHNVDSGDDQRDFGRWTFFDITRPTLFSLLKAAEHEPSLEQEIMLWSEPKYF